MERSPFSGCLYLLSSFQSPRSEKATFRITEKSINLKSSTWAFKRVHDGFALNIWESSRQPWSESSKSIIQELKVNYPRAKSNYLLAHLLHPALKIIVIGLIQFIRPQHAQKAQGFMRYISDYFSTLLSLDFNPIHLGSMYRGPRYLCNISDPWFNSDDRCNSSHVSFCHNQGKGSMMMTLMMNDYNSLWSNIVVQVVQPSL